MVKVYERLGWVCKCKTLSHCDSLLYTSTLNVKKISNSGSTGKWPTVLDGVKSEIKTSSSPPSFRGYEATRVVFPAILNSCNREQVLILFFQMSNTVVPLFPQKTAFGLKLKCYRHCLRNSAKE